MNVREIEQKIIRKIIYSAFQAGYSISVNDGEETVLKKSKDKDAIIGAMFSTDEDYLYFYKDDKNIGTVYLVYGNSGHDVICDYSDNPPTNDVLKSAFELSDKLGEE